MSLASLENSLRLKTKERKTISSRKEAVNNIINNVDGKLDDEIGAVNGRIAKCSAALASSVSNVSRVRTVADSIDSAKERYPAGDTKIASCREALVNERNRCERKISQLDGEIARLKEAIRIERERLLQEAMDKAVAILT